MNRDNFKSAINKTLNSVIKIERSDGGIGSGIILNDGAIITCDHVIQGATSINVKFRDGIKFNADVIGAEHSYDLALLRLRDSADLKHNSKLNNGLSFVQVNLEPGEQLKAIGHPLNLEWAVTGGCYNAKREAGEISKFGINLKTYLLQVDVSINQGNSGGPLIDIHGNIIGIATAIINPSKVNNIGFIIPAETIIKFQNSIETNIKDAKALTLFSCWHYHSADQKWCNITGKSINIINEQPQNIQNNDILYSCGHTHFSGIKFCPSTGKPITAIESILSADNPNMKTKKILYNCGHEHPCGLKICPDLGKPIKPV